MTPQQVALRDEGLSHAHIAEMSACYGAEAAETIAAAVAGAGVAFS